MRKNSFVNKLIAYTCVSALAFSSMAGMGVGTAKAEETETPSSITLNDEGSPFVKEFVGTNDGYDYLGYVYDCGATSEHDLLALTYTGNLTGIRLEFDGNVVWFNEAQESHFVTDDGSSIELVAEEETTVWIDLAASGVDFGAVDGFHVHGEAMITNGGFNVIDATLYRSQDFVIDEDAFLTLDDEGSPFVKEFAGTNDGYDYLGYVYDCGATSAHKWLSLTYTGNITGIRLEFDGNVVWFDETQENHFVTVDGSSIPLVAEEETTVLIDLVASGVDFGAVDGFHIHGEKMITNGGFNIIDATLIKDDSEEESSEEPTSEESEVTTADTETTAAELETSAADDILLNGTESGSSMIGTYKVPASANQYKYLGFASLKDPTAEYKYLVITYTGDITSLRFEFAMVTDGEETAKSSAYWFNAEGQENYFVTADESAIPLDGGNGTTIVIDLEKTGISLASYNSVHMHAGYGKSEDGSKFPEINFAITNARLSKTAEVKDTDKETVTQMPTTKAPETTRVQQTTKAPEVTTTTVAEVKKPAKAKVKSATKAKNAKKAKITLRKVKNAVGYEVRISTSKKFKNKATIKKFTKKVNVTFKKLKKNKKYYVKARAYVLDVKGNKVYGKWSKVKVVKAPKKNK